MAITPRKSRGLDFGDVRHVCQDYTLAGLQAMFEARGESGTGVTPFRFMYLSGRAVERDQNKTPTFMPPYSLMRVSMRTKGASWSGKDLAEADDAATYQGETENRVLAFSGAQ